MSMDSCEKHGRWEVNRQNACPSCEITLLRAEVKSKTEAADWFRQRAEELSAEVERLKNELKTYEVNWPDVKKLERERDEALDTISVAQKDLVCTQHEGYKMVWCTQCIKVERETSQQREQEALITLAGLVQSEVLATREEGKA